MAWTYEADRFDTGEVVDPRPVMRLFNRLAGEMNGHWDRDNTPRGLLTKDKLAVKALVEAGYYVDGSAVVNLPAGQTGGWVSVSTATRTLTCDSDGYLRVSASLPFYWGNVLAANTKYNEKAQFRLMINGLQVAVSGWHHWANYYDAVRLVGGAPVTAGSAVVTPQVRIYASPFSGTTDITNGSVTTALATANNSTTYHEITVSTGVITHTFRKR